jgi:hypothetical protein
MPAYSYPQLAGRQLTGRQIMMLAASGGKGSGGTWFPHAG